MPISRALRSAARHARTIGFELLNRNAPKKVRRQFKLEALEQRELLSASEPPVQMAAQETQIVAPVAAGTPDLRVTNFTSPASAQVGDFINVSYTVTNIGDVTAVSGSPGWLDSVILSEDASTRGAVFEDDDDIVLTNKFNYRGITLAPGESYTDTKTVQVKGGGGAKHLFVVVGEFFNEDPNRLNNQLSNLINVTVPSVDLQVTGATAPPSILIDGTTQFVGITVKNEGTEAATRMSFDEVYLSSDPFFDNDPFSANPDERVGSLTSSGRNPLAPGASYTASGSINIGGSAFAAGPQYLIFAADGANVQGETNEANNYYAVPVMLSHPETTYTFGDDLRVTSLTVPTTGVAGSTIPVTWTVKNFGNAPSEADWLDEVTIQYQFIRGSVQFDAAALSPLAPGASYTGTANLLIPATMPAGTHIVEVQVDAEFQLNDDNRGNRYLQPIAVTVPVRSDLIVSAATADANLVVGQEFQLQYTIKNQGTDATPASAQWRETFVFSKNSTLGDFDDILVDKTELRPDNNPLGANATYNETRTLVLPGGISGSGFLYVVADGDTRLAETNEANNFLSIPVNVTGPDLVITGGSAPLTSRLGDTIEISYTLANQGAATATGERYDEIYLSADNVLDDADIYVRFNEYVTNLAAGADTLITTSVKLPTGPIGNVFLIIKADDGSEIAETSETNNTRAVPISLTGADLVVTAGTTAATITPGEELSVSWTVKNNGNAPANEAWYERFYLSNDGVFDFNDEPLAQPFNARVTPLVPGAEYSSSFAFEFPDAQPGNRFLLIVADGFFGQAESSDANNVHVVPITVNAPELTVTNFTAPADARLGVPFEVSWTVQNTGTVAAKLPWTDVIRLSTDATVENTDPFVTSEFRSIELAAGASYTITKNVTVTNATIGAYSLILQADGFRDVSEANETNNINVRAITIGAADLTVANVSLPATLQSGQTFAITWNDVNAGNVAIGSNWSDLITIRNVTTGQELGLLVLPYDVAISGNLAAAGSAARTVDFTLPEGPAGVGEIEVTVTTDAQQRIAEANLTNTAEQNNSTVSARIGSTLAPYADLQVANIAVPANLESGLQFTVNWTVANNGNKATSGNFSDRIVIVNTTTGETLATANVPYNASLAGNGPIEPGGSRQQQYTFRLPDGVRGVGQIQFNVTTDEVAQVLEFNAAGTAETNNAGTLTAASVLAAYPDLNVTQITTPVGASSGSNVTVNWTLNNLGNKATSGTWTDRVVARNLTTGVVIMDTTVPYNSGAIAAGGSAARQFTFALPEGPNGAGQIEFTVTSDSGNALLEIAPGADAEANNVSVATFSSVLAPYPDLVVSNIVAPASATDGENIEITWTITNQGNGPLTTGWTDQLFFSADGLENEGDLNLGSFPIAMTLAPGASIQRTQVVTIPVDFQGTRKILVKTDATNSVAEFTPAGTADTNNLTADDQQTAVSLAPRPNLQVTSITAPASAFSGQPTSVQWTVKNTGAGATSVPVWRDSVFISNDPVFDISDPFLGSFENGSYLDPGDSYVSNANVTLPEGLNGPFYFFVRADVTFNNVLQNRLETTYVRESNETDNGAAATSPTQVTLTPPPDLQITLNAPTQAFSGQPFSVTWTVTNQGVGPTRVANWTDSIFLSTDDTIDSADRVLANVPHAATLVRTVVESNGQTSVTESMQGGILQPGQSYTVTQQYTLPVGESGDFFVLARTDSDNVVYENTGEGNNVATDSLRINLTPPPDLEVESITVPATALSSQSLRIDYRVTNFGSTSTPENGWSDRVYLSSDATFDPTNDLFLGDVKHLGALDSDGSYNQSASFFLRDGLAGNFHVFITTDAYNQVFELNNANNTLQSEATIAIESRPADLVVLSAAGPAQGQAGGTVQLRWTVANLGVGATSVSSWSDTVLVSSTNDPSNARSLGTFARNGALQPGETYFAAHNVELPLDLKGELFFFIRTTSSAYEAGSTANNTSAAIPINVDQQLADLQVSNVVATAAVASDQKLNVSWTVTNAGTARTNVGFWDDIIVLVPTSGAGPNLEIGRIFRGGGLDAGATYTGTASLSLPIDLQGSYSVMVTADARNTAFEGANEGNNSALSPAATTISIAPVADLQMQNVSPGGSDFLSGQVMHLTWTVRNGGAAATTAPWRATFYLSRDPVFDARTDVYLGYTDHNGNVAPNATYTGMNSFRVPRGLSGTYYVFAVADASDNVYERANEGNNVGRSVGTVAVTLAPPADLVAGTITIPANAVAGSEVSLTYTVRNSGANAARGSWFDSLYISGDTSFDIGDLLIGRVGHAGDLGPNQSYTATLEAPLPGMPPGEYHVILRSDIRNHINESNEANNVSASIDDVTVTVPALTLGQPVTGTLGAGKAAFYRVDVAAGEALLFTFDSANNSGVNELYVSHGEVPSRSAFDLAFSAAATADQEIMVPFTEAGTYYVMAYGAVGAASTYTLKAEIVPFAVRSIDPGEVGNAGSVTLEIKGARFTDDTVFQAVDPSGAVINPTRVIFNDSSSVYATFDLTGKAVGAYDVRATNPGNQVTQLDNQLNVVIGRGAHITAAINGPAVLRVDVNYVAYIDFVNDGDSDAAVPAFVIRNDSGTPIGFSRDSIAPVSSLQILGNEDGALGGILRPGERRSIPFYFTAKPIPQVNLELLTISETDTTPIDYAIVEATLRSHDLVPAELTLAEFETAFAALKTQIGGTWGDYIKTLSRNAGLVPEAEGSTRSAVPMLGVEFRRALAATGTSLTGTLRSNHAALDAAGQLVTAVNLTTGDSYSSFALNDGSFIFGRVAAGDYRFEVDGALVSSGATALVASGESLTGLNLGIESGGTIRGTAVKSGTNEVLANATVRLVSADGRLRSVQTDENGAYVLTGLAAGTYDLSANAEGRARLSMDDIVVSSPTGTLVRPLSFAAEAVIKSSVIFQTGGPASVLRVDVTDVADPTRVFTATVTDQTYSVGQLAAGTYRLTFSAEGYITSSRDVTVAAQQTALVDSTTLLRGATAAGVVSSADPTVAAAFSLVGLYQGDTLVAAEQASATGAFKFSELAPGTYTLRIAPGNAAYSTTQTFTVTAGQDVADQNLQLSPGGTVFGKVRNPGGTPLSGVEVFLTNAAGALISAISGADGSYRFTGLGLGTYTTFVNAPGSAAANSQVTSLTGAPITADLSVAAIATLGGKLQSAAGGQIAGIVSLLLDGVTVASTRTDAAGNYLFLIERAGTYTVQASAARASFDPSAPIAVANGSAIQQTLSSGTGRVSLTLTDALQAVEGASVLLNRVLGDGSIATAGSATVGADGAATFENLAAGNYRVSVTGANNRAGTVSTAVAAGATASINAALTQQSALQGRITGTGGAPVANVSVVLRSTVDGSIEGVGATNAAGDYDLTHVAPGIYELIAVAAGFQALVLPSVTVGAAPTTFDTALTISTTKLRGQALTADGQPLRVGLVTVSDAAGRTLGVAGLNNDGTFEVDSASGTGLRVKIAAEGFVAAQQTGVNVTAGTTQTIAALTLEGAALGASTSVRAALPGQPGVLPPVIAFGQARERFEALGNGDLLGFLKSLFAAFEKNDDHISFGDVPEPCSDEAAAATLSERIKLLNSIGLQNDAFEAISPRQNTLRYSTLLLSLELLAASVDTAAQGTLILASILPLGKLIKEGGALARGEDLVEATATFRQASVELFSAIVGIEENVRQLLSDFNGVTATIYGFAEADSPSDLAGQVDAAIKDINAMAGLAVEIGTRFATLMKDDVAGKALSILGPFVGPIGALASIPGYLASIRNNTQQLRGTVQTINTEYELLKGSVEQYETFVDVANRRLTEYILALEKADCDPDDPRDDDEDDDGIPDDEDDDDNSDDPDGPFGPGGSGGGGSGAGYNPPVTTPKDPNDIIGPVGFGEDRWVNVTTPMHYMIRYENAPEATAPAQEVLITQQLDPDLDWRTFRLEDFGWGDVVVELQGNQSFYSGRVDLMETKGFVVDVTAFIDIQTGLATWTLTTIDPATGEKPIDATLGFLPPDVPNGVGDGFVNYTIRPLRTAETGARIDAKASIIFDTNEPIDTPPIFNTIDSTKPTSGINPLAALTNNTNFQVSWTSADPSGSAVKEVDVYVSDNGAPASLWLGKTELREATYAGESGHTYTFHTLARDNAGNEQSFATAAKVSTLVTGLGNTDPVAQANRALQIQEDAVTALGITAPTDADNDALFILVNTLPDATKGVIRRADNTLVEAGDLLTVAQLMALTFTPIANISGPAGSFSYTVNDGQGGTATQTITLAVVDENDPPTVQPNKTVELLEDAAATPLGITAPSDSEGDALIITVTSLPDVLKGQVRLADGTPVAAGALLTIQQLLELQFLPAPNAFGPAGTFVYSVADSLGGTAAQTVALVVTGVNDAPIVGESQTTRALTNTALGLVAPVDPDGDALSVVVTTLPDPAMGQITLANGSAVTLGANLSAEELVGLRYAPAAGAIGNAGAFAFSVSDGTAAAVVQTITLVNVPFVTFDKKNPLIFTDADGDKVTVTLKGEGSGFARFEGDASDNADLGSLVLTGTDAKSGLKVSVKQTGGLGTTRVAHISTNGDEQGLGSLVLDSSVTLGTGEADAAAEILIGGGIKTLTLGDIAANATIRLGADLDASDTAKVAALNPSVKFGNVLGANVTLDVRGGLKGIAGESWSFPGSISTLQSIGGIKLAGDFGASLAVDAASVATGVANVGAISVGGAYTGTTTIVEGSIKTLTAKGLLSSAISTVGIGNVSAAQIVQTTLIASGDIGNITAMLKDATGTVIVIDRLSVVAGGEIGKISAAVKGTSALTSAVGIQDSNFASGGSIGGFAISGTSKNAAATFAGIANSEISAQGSVGKITAPSATDLRVFTGGALSSIEVKSGKNASGGMILRSEFLVGQNMVINDAKDLKSAGIGKISASGVIEDSVFAALGNIGSISAGGDVDGVTIIAGVNAGSVIFTADDQYHRHASIASVKFMSALRNSSLVQGLNPGTDFAWGGGIGDAADTVGEAISGLKNGKIGAISLGATTVGSGVLKAVSGPANAPHSFAIEGLELTKLQIGKLPTVKTFTQPQWMDADGDGIEDADELLVRTMG